MSDSMYVSRGQAELVRKMRKVSRLGLSKGKRLEERVRELQAKLADSVLKAELESIKRELQSKIANLEEKLSVSVPRTEADALADKANRLETALTETREKLNSAETKSRELEHRLSESVPRREPDAAKAQAESTIHHLQEKFSESKNEAETLRQRVAELESRIAQTEKELEAARIHIRQLEAPSNSSSGHAVS